MTIEYDEEFSVIVRLEVHTMTVWPNGVEERIWEQNSEQPSTITDVNETLDYAAEMASPNPVFIPTPFMARVVYDWL